MRQKSPLSRRSFLKTATGAAAALALPSFIPRAALGASTKLRIAGIGVGGKGEVDIGYCAGEDVVALCDVDDANAAATFQRFPSAVRYRDYRKMLDVEAKRIDAVTVSTPDHVHASAAILAMRMGKHVFCQKPLTRTVAEARRMLEVARDTKVVTQMGNQGFAHPGTRRLVELVRAGVLGRVREAHVWTDRPIWPQGIERPKDTPAVPATLDWDLWLGPAPARPYHSAYVPFRWRGFWDFGTGALGDMGCHNFALPFWALDLRDPASVAAESSPVNTETAPSWSVIKYEFAALGERQPVTLTWHDGGKQPPRDLVKGEKLPANGVILAGEKDTLFVSSYWGGGRFLSGARTEDFKDVPQSLPRVEGGERDNDEAHHREWIVACKGGPAPQSSFAIAAPFTEMVLLGNVALRAGTKIEWDAPALRVKNAPDAQRFVHGEYRKGWEI